MIIFRYLAKEVGLTLVALTAILMLIFLSNQFIQYLNRAAAGGIPGMIIMKLMLIELPNLVSLLLPLGFYVALLLAYGRLYAENEMTVLRACGYGPNQLLQHSLIMAACVALFVGVLMLCLSPHIASMRAKLLSAAGVQTLIKTLMPGRFHGIRAGQQVFYVQSMNRDHSKADQIFLSNRSMKDHKVAWDILWAEKAFAEHDPKTMEDYLVLQDGKAYQGIPGQADYQIAEFKEYRTRLPHPEIDIGADIRTYETRQLLPFNNPDLKKAAEMQWRLSVPIMVLVLTLVAVPLSRVSPRSGKYAQLLPAIILYILYANALFVVRNALIEGTIPLWLGFWWLHGLVALLGLFLIWRNRVQKA